MDGETALMVKPGDVKGVADSIARLADDPKLRESLGRNVRRAAEEKHTWIMNAAKVVSVVTGGHGDVPR